MNGFLDLTSFLLKTCRDFWGAVGINVFVILIGAYFSYLCIRKKLMPLEIGRIAFAFFVFIGLPVLAKELWQYLGIGPP